MFCDVLKKLRLSKNLSQEELAEIIGVSKSTIGMYEQGNRMPKADATLKKLADYFDVSIDYLLGIEKKSEHKQINNMLRTPEEEAELNEYLEAVHNDPNLRMMFSLAKNAKKEDVEKAVAIIKALLGKD